MKTGLCVQLFFPSLFYSLKTVKSVSADISTPQMQSLLEPADTLLFYIYIYEAFFLFLITYKKQFLKANLIDKQLLITIYYKMSLSFFVEFHSFQDLKTRLNFYDTYKRYCLVDQLATTACLLSLSNPI